MAEEKDKKNNKEQQDKKTDKEQQDQENEKTVKVRPTNTKTIPIIITLAAALTACIMSILQHVEFKIYVERLLISVIVFGIIGIVIRVILDRFFFRTKDIEEALDEKNEDGDSSDDDEDEEKDE